MSILTYDPDLMLMRELEAHLRLFKYIKRDSSNALTTIQTDKLQKIMELAFQHLKF